LHRAIAADALVAGIGRALTAGSIDAAVVAIEARRVDVPTVVPIGEGLSRFDRPAPSEYTEPERSALFARHGVAVAEWTVVAVVAPLPNREPPLAITPIDPETILRASGALNRAALASIHRSACDIDLLVDAASSMSSGGCVSV